MTLDGFIQPSMARSLIELQSNVEKGLGIRTLFGNFFGNNRCAYKKE